jgi:outer membrane protein assembly factor BamA
VAFYSSETGFGGGGGGVITYRGRGCPPPARPQSLSAVVFYTAKGQSLVALAPELYFDDEAWELKVGLTYRNFPDRFYGVGRDTPEDSEEEYTLEGMKVRPWLLRRVVSHLYVGAIFDVEKTNILEVEEGGLLDQRALAGHAGGLRVGAGPVLDWDSRDNIFYPSRGAWYQCYASFYRGGLGSDFDYDSWTVDLRRYLTLRPLHILAFQVLATGRSGDVPFDQLARMGDVVRGIYAGRFQDQFLGAAQMEYRFPISRRFSGVLFAAAGDVSPTVEDFEFGEPKLAGGAGLRFALNVEEKVNFRFDLGVSRWGVEPYFQFSEAF